MPSMKDDLKTLEEASGQARYLNIGKGELAIKTLKYVSGGEGGSKFIAECPIVVSDGPNNPEGELVSIIWRAAWEGHMRELKGFLAAATSEPLAIGAAFVKQASHFFGDDQPLRGRRVEFVATEKVNKGGIPSKFPKIAYNKVNQTDEDVATLRARFE
jgi:hypothetical protein